MANRKTPPTARELEVRRRFARTGARVANRLHDYLEYVGIAHLPADRGRSRWGHGRAPHARLERIISAGSDAYAKTFTTLAAYADDLAEVRRTDPEPGEPFWINDWIPGLDGAALYGLVRSVRPARFLEVGSGVSTTWVHRARRDENADTEIISIDPEPRREIDAICDRVIRAPLESTDLSMFSELRAGDMTFIDNSHLALMNSDVVTFFFDVLPELAPGVVVGIHDILLPEDYYPGWGEYYFSEQYLLGSMLLGGTGWMEPVLASWWASGNPELQTLMDPLWRHPKLAGVAVRGTSFWFRTSGGLGD